MRAPHRVTSVHVSSLESLLHGTRIVNDKEAICFRMASKRNVLTLLYATFDHDLIDFNTLVAAKFFVKPHADDAWHDVPGRVVHRRVGGVSGFAL